MIDNNDDAYRDQVKENYEFSTWAGRTKAGDGNVRISGFQIEAGDLQGWKLEEKEDLPASGRHQRVTRYIHSPSRESTSQRYASTVYECNSVLDAHEALIDVVMTYMAPQLPRCETKGLEAGDICFGSHGEVNLSVIFARFNVLVQIQSTTLGPAPVNSFAAQVDSLILARYAAPK